MLIEHRHGDIEDQRAGCPPCGVPVRVSLHFAEFRKDPRFEERLDQREHPLVLDPDPHPVHQGRVRDTVEGRLDVSIQDPPISGRAEVMDLRDGIVCSPHGPEPIGDRQEVGLKDRLQHQLQRRLDHPIGHGDIPRLRHLSRPARFRNLRSRTGIGRKVPVQLGTQVLHEPPDTDALFDIGGPQAVDAGCLRPGCPRPGSNAMTSVAGSCTRLNRSSNLRPGSAAAQR